jgi:hypothetical protein
MIDATSSVATSPLSDRAAIERSGKFTFSKVRWPRINSEFLQLTVIEMPERCPSLLIFTTSPKPKRDAAHGLADRETRHHLTIGDRNALSLKPARHDALPINDRETILDNIVNLDDSVKNKPVE